MAGPSQMVTIKKDTEQAILVYAQKAHELLMNQFSLRTNLETIDRYYIRETDWTTENIRAKIANRLGDKKKYQNVTVPIIMPQVRAALGYFTNVFLTGYPTFGVSSDPDQEDAALAMETVIAENSITAGWTRQLLMFFQDGLKYNLHGLECEWMQQTVGGLENDMSAPNGVKPKNVLWKGNALRRMDLYNSFFDPRVHPAEVHSKGEYAGYIELLSRVQMKKMINDLFGKIPIGTVQRAFESGPAPGGMTGSGSPFAYYVPLINPYPIMDRQNLQFFDWMSWAQYGSGKVSNIKYNNVYEVMRIYARILPSDFGINAPEENTPQVWKFIIINGSVILFAERQSNAHNYIPIVYGQPLEDGLDFQTKSFASNVMDMQDLASAAMNGYIASKRRLVGDRVLYDPIRITAKDINSENPAAKIPVRPSAYGKPPGEAVYQFPYHDEATQTLLQAADVISKYADKINNQNPATQGQFVKGNKTLHEYEDVMGHGNSNNQVMGIATEQQVFTPIKEIIKLNILQFQEQTQLYNRSKQTQVDVDPVALRKAAIHFRVSDGMLPVEKLMSEDAWQTALQAIGSSPQLGQGYNVAPMFTYLMKLQGADLSPFEKSQLQLQYEQAVASWQQVAMEAVKQGQQPPPQPQMPPELIQELQGKQQAPKPNPTGQALESTQGNT